ncbi:CopD family protein [Nonomuraea dietziae]|uniref:CopD family protein n=1 Tax=Nonomuraea dietziae TaxID=65515 RepID=UPI0031D43C5E
MDVAGLLTVGLLLTATAFLPNDKGLLGTSALGYVKAASWTALVWAGAGALTMVFTLSETLGLPVADVLGGNELTSFASQVGQGIALTLVVLFGVSIALFSRGAITAGASAGLLALALVTLLPPALTSPRLLLAQPRPGHHGRRGPPDLAGAVGRRPDRARDPRDAQAAAAGGGGGARFSRMAVWCYVGVGLSGVFSVLARLTAISDLWTSPYGVLLVVKTVAFVLLGYVGWWHRQRTMGELAKGKARRVHPAGGRRAGPDVRDHGAWPSRWPAPSRPR